MSLARDPSAPEPLACMGWEILTSSSVCICKMGSHSVPRHSVPREMSCIAGVLKEESGPSEFIRDDTTNGSAMECLFPELKVRVSKRAMRPAADSIMLCVLRNSSDSYDSRQIWISRLFVEVSRIRRSFTM